jgi:hypothetical protein
MLPNETPSTTLLTTKASNRILARSSLKGRSIIWLELNMRNRIAQRHPRPLTTRF